MLSKIILFYLLILGKININIDVEPFLSLDSKLYLKFIVLDDFVNIKYKMENFERIRKLGKGNFGDVLLVERLTDKANFALKRIDLRDKDTFTVDPQTEVKVLKSLDHPNIIRYYDTFMHKKKLCIQMEFADNGDLSKPIKDHKKTSTFIPEEQYQVLSWFTQLCLAVQYLHSQKVLHRDVKVQNVFLSKENLVKLGDFGISKILEDTSELAQTSIGTPFYLSPEICQSSHYNHKIDIWMLGCTLYELCSLQKPFQGDSINNIVYKIMNEHPPAIPSHYSQFVVDMVDWMLEKNPDNRPEVATILQMPQMQRELQKIKNVYAQHGIVAQLPLHKPPLSIKLRSEMTEPHEEEKKPSFQQQITPPTSTQHQQQQEKSPAQRRTTKSKETSFQYVVEQARQQQHLSPLLSKRSTKKTPTHTQTNQLNVNSSPFIQPLLIPTDTSGSKPASAILSHQSSPHFKLQGGFGESLTYRNLTSLPDHEDDLLTNKGRSYQRIMSINTQLEGNFKNQQSASSHASEIVKTNEQQTLIKPKSFAFGEYIFNPNAPASPNRTILFTAFLKRKLGDQRFQQMKILLESSVDPMDLMDNQRQKVLAILGEDNMDCIKIFKILITSSVTPSSSHFRTKSAQIFNQQLETPQSQPKTEKATSQKTQSEEQSGLMELLKDIEMPKEIKPIGQNEGFEISFKNFQNYEG